MVVCIRIERAVSGNELSGTELASGGVAGGVPLADLCIGFTVPGFDNVVLPV